jgi:hypothetical protein
MKTLSRSTIYSVIFFACCLFVASGTLAQPGLKFWAMDVGNYWKLDGSNFPNLWTWKWRTDVAAVDTTTVPGVTLYRFEGRDTTGGEPGFLEEKQWYSASATEIRLWRVEFFETGWNTITIDGGAKDGITPIVVGGSWTEFYTGTCSGPDLPYIGPINITV